MQSQLFGASLSLNRAIAFLKSEKYLDNEFPTCKRDNKEKIAASFALVLSDAGHFRTLKKAILEGFIPKEAAVKNVCHQQLILEVVDEKSLVQQGGRPVEQIALLACALADPDLTSKFTGILAPVDAVLRPAILDQGAAHVSLARWTILAELMNAKKNRTRTYSQI